MIKKNLQIEIIMSTFNGESYIEEQLESIVAQTNDNWRLLIRDDGSVDATLEIISAYCVKYKDRISLLQDNYGNIGPSASFGVLLESTTADYVAFCDQDDVWDIDKLEIQFEQMIELERVYGDIMPILVHTDLTVIDDKAAILNNSFWEYQNLSPGRMSSLPGLLVQNYVTGCTVLINRALIDKSLPIPGGVIMHDWWLALVAIAEGQIYNMDVSTVKYRQHSANDTGAKKWDILYKITAIFSAPKYYKIRFERTCNQACALLSSNALSPCNKSIVERYVAMYKMRWLKKRIEMIKMGFYMNGLLRNLAMFVYL